MTLRVENCLVGWLASDLVSDSTIKELMAAGLRTEGLFAEAEKYRKRVASFMPSNRAKALDPTVTALKDATEGNTLGVQDIRSRTRRYETMPLVLS
jgi:hypothetical protein